MCKIAEEVRPAEPSTNEDGSPVSKKSAADIAASVEAAKLREKVDEAFKLAKLDAWKAKLANGSR